MREWARVVKHEAQTFFINLAMMYVIDVVKRETTQQIASVRR